MARILLIDDDHGGRQMGCYNLRAAGHEVDEAADGRAGLALFRPTDHDLVIADVRMPEMSGIEVLKAIHEQAAETPVLLITAFGRVEVAVEAMKAGAFDFVLKPFTKDQLLLSVDKALKHHRLEQENRALRRQLAGVERPIVGASEAMKRSMEMTDRVAGADTSVLVSGESGTGKELIARRIHARSPRASGPFVPVNCAAIPTDLLEAELFGHTKGAFTGAVRSRAGRFRQADGGTLFLDEVAELPMPVQGKLLRVLQERVVDVLGADQPVAVDVRIVAATNRALLSCVKDGRFREDLYYRLNVVDIEVPPLRQRREDIPLLVRYFVDELAPGRDLETPEGVMATLMQRPWPGNVRELRNACERMLILSPHNELTAAVLPAQEPGAMNGQGRAANTAGALPWFELPPEGFSLVDLEKQVIEQTLAKHRGNISEAARYLRVPRHILVYRIEKYGIQRIAKA